MKISSIEEKRFSIAASLHTGGRFSNAVYCKGKDVFVCNTDHTVLIRFVAERSFEEEVRFFANDYASDELEMVEGGVVFLSKGKASDAKILNRVPDTTFEEIEVLHKKYQPKRLINRVTLSRALVFEHLQEDLSHIEFGSQGGSFFIVQRDLYSGRLIKAWPKEGRLGLFRTEGDWEFRGYRTSDVKALLDFTESLGGESLDVYFVDPFYSWVKNDKLKMEGMMTTCLYDELGELGVLEEGGGSNGGKKSEKRRRVKALDSTVERGIEGRGTEKKFERRPLLR